MFNPQDLKVGNQIKITDFYLSNYSTAWTDKIKDQPATIVSIRERQVAAEKLREAKILPMYLELYGLHKVYPIIEIYIQFPEDKSLYLVSPFGFR